MLSALEEYGCWRICDRITPNKMVDIEKSRSSDLSFHTLSCRDFIILGKSLIFFITSVDGFSTISLETNHILAPIQYRTSYSYYSIYTNELLSSLVKISFN